MYLLILLTLIKLKKQLINNLVKIIKWRYQKLIQRKQSLGSY